MRIMLIGYGRMGHEIEQLAPGEGHEVVSRIDRENASDLNAGSASGCDVAIEFTSPDAAPELIIKALRLGLPVVSGSTGWLERYDEVTTLCKDLGGSFIWSSNFSIGVNILFRLNAELARIMNNLPDYHAVVEEIHHIYKLDSPSGTAITLAGGIAGHHGAYDGWTKEEESVQERIRGGKIPIASERTGAVPGTHSVKWTSVNDVITIRHEAFSRRGFAAGALAAAEFISTRKGVFTMSDVLDL